MPDKPLITIFMRSLPHGIARAALEKSSVGPFLASISSTEGSNATVLQRAPCALEHFDLRVGHTECIATNVAFLRYHEKAECALPQKDRSGNNADGLQRAHSTKEHMHFRLFPLLPRCPQEIAPHQSQVRPFVSNGERIWKNIAISLTLAPSSYERARARKSLVSREENEDRISQGAHFYRNVPLDNPKNAVIMGRNVGRAPDPKNQRGFSYFLLRKLFSGVLNSSVKSLDRPPKPIQAFMIYLAGKSAFQAGCRGFESRLPLFNFVSCLSHGFSGPLRGNCYFSTYEVALLLCVTRR